MTMSPRDARIAAGLFEMVIRATTQSGETENARVGLIALFARSGTTFEDLISAYIVSSPSDTTSILGYLDKIRSLEKSLKVEADKLVSSEKKCSELQRQLSQVMHEKLELEQTVRDTQAKCEELRAQVDDLNTTLASQEHTNDQGRQYVEFDNFAHQARTKFGHPRWKSVFAHHLRKPNKELAAWAIVGIAPIEFVSALNDMSKLDCQPASRRQWTAKELHRLDTLRRDEHRDHDIAHILSGEFKRRIFESAITSRRRRLARSRVNATGSVLQQDQSEGCRNVAPVTEAWCNQHVGLERPPPGSGRI